MPFFMNSARLQTSSSYFKTNYRPDELCNFDLSDEPELSNEGLNNLETFANQGYYGMPRFLPLGVTKQDEKLLSLDDCDEDNDEMFSKITNKIMDFGLIWLTLRRLFTSAKGYFKKRDLTVDNLDIETDIEMGENHSSVSSIIDIDEQDARIVIEPNEVIEWDELCEVDLSPSIDSDDSSSSMIYADDTASIQQFKITAPDGRIANVVQFSVAGCNDKTIFTDACQNAMDLKSLVLSENCASLMWVWSEESCIVLITESSDPCCWSVQQWFRKILSDMALTDSIMIGHPYYWHPVVRRKLKRTVKQFKKLYKMISFRKSSIASLAAQDNNNSADEPDRNNLKLMCPRGVTQVTIAGGSSKKKRRPFQGQISEDMVNDLWKRWDSYKVLVGKEDHATVDLVSDKYFSKPSGSSNEGETQSTTFLSFSDSVHDTVQPPDVTMVSSVNQVKEVRSLHYRNIKDNLEGDYINHRLSYDDIPVPVGFRPLESGWNDKAFKKSFLGQNMKPKGSSSEVTIQNKKKRSKHNHRQRKLRE